MGLGGLIVLFLAGIGGLTVLVLIGVGLLYAFDDGLGVSDEPIHREVGEALVKALRKRES